jgi:hypothetical protein
MTRKTQEMDGKAPTSPDSKPEKLAKIMYAGIVRYIKAKNARNREKNAKFALDFSRERRVNMISDNID